MTKRFAIAAIFVCMVLIAAAYASAFLPGGAPRIAEFVVAIATAGVMVSTMTLGAARGGRVESIALRVIFVITFVLLAAGFCAALMTAPVTPQARLWLGLPKGAAIIIYIVGLVPMLVLPIAYAVTFKDES
jgi:hypothetical protein